MILSGLMNYRKMKGIINDFWYSNKDTHYALYSLPAIDDHSRKAHSGDNAHIILRSCDAEFNSEYISVSR
jgi:hypothetical protein